MAAERPRRLLGLRPQPQHRVSSSSWRRRPRSRADALDKRLQAKCFKIRGCSVRTSAETQPCRCRACAKYYFIMDSLRVLRVDGRDYEPCSRGLAAYRVPGWELLFKLLYEDATMQWAPKELEALGLQVAFDDTLQELEVDGIPGGTTPVPQDPPSPAPAQPPRSGKGSAKTPGATPQGQPSAKQAKKDDVDVDVDIEPVAGAGGEWGENAAAAAAEHMEELHSQTSTSLPSADGEAYHRRDVRRRVPGPHRRGRERLAAATWNTRAAVWANAGAVLQDVEDEMQTINERGLEFALIQEDAPPWERVAEPPESPSWCWVCNDKAPTDTAIAIRRRWEQNIVDIKCKGKWVGVLLTKSDGHIALVSALMPTSWDTVESWIKTLASIGEALRHWCAAHSVRETIIGADWNIDLQKDDALCHMRAHLDVPCGTQTS